MKRYLVCGGAALLLLIGAACSGDADSSDSPDPTATSGVSDGATEPASTDVADAPTEAPTEAATEEPDGEGGDGVGSAMLTIGDDTWEFDSVTFCTTREQEDGTISFVTLSRQGEFRLLVKITDPSGERRLEGDGVWDSIDLQFTEGSFVRVFVAGSEAAGAQFLLFDGSSERSQLGDRNLSGVVITASANFDDQVRTNEIEEIPGTLAVTCP